MKKLIPFIIITFSVFILHSCFKANDNVGHDGRCTGSAYCSACTNCSRCGHCGSGGSCGVCSGGSSKSSSSSASSSKRSRYKKHKSSKVHTRTESKPHKVSIDEVNINIGTNNRYLTGVGAATTIYEKPAFKSNVVAIVTRNAKLVQLSKKGEWYKVKIKSSGKKGYVYHKNVK